MLWKLSFSSKVLEDSQATTLCHNPPVGKFLFKIHLRSLSYAILPKAESPLELSKKVLKIMLYLKENLLGGSYFSVK